MRPAKGPHLGRVSTDGVTPAHKVLPGLFEAGQAAGLPVQVVAGGLAGGALGQQAVQGTGQSRAYKQC